MKVVFQFFSDNTETNHILNLLGKVQENIAGCDFFLMELIEKKIKNSTQKTQLKKKSLLSCLYLDSTLKCANIAGVNFLTLLPCYLRPFILQVSEALLDRAPSLFMKSVQFLTPHCGTL